MSANIVQLETAAGNFRVALDGPENAPVIIFSNSLGTTLEMWQPQVEALAGDFRIVRYDTRGHGGSPITPAPYTFDQLAEDVLAIMDALNIEKACFCGVSMGGHTALKLGIMAQERFELIVACNTAAKIGTAEGWQERADMLRRDGKAGIQALADSAPERWFKPEYIEANPEVVKSLQDQFATLDAEGYAACCDALGQSDLTASLREIAIPTLIVAGEHDPVTTVKDAQNLNGLIKGSSVAVLDASHISNIEAADAFNQALRNFIEVEGRFERKIASH